VQNDDDNNNVFDNDQEHPEQPESVNEPYPVEQDEHNIIIDSLDMSYDREQDDQDDTDDLAKERDLLASLIEKLKCEIDDSKNCNKFLESSNKALIDKLKGEIEDFKTKNKSLESSNNHSKEANNELSKTNQLMLKDLKRFQAELDRYHDVNYASKVAIDYAKAKGDLMEYYYVDHTNAILGVYTTLDEFTDLQYDYVDRVVKCEHHEKELSKSNTTSKSFEALQKHTINFELALQQYLKAQLQDNGIAISELKKLIEKMKGKYVETKFEKSSVIRQPNAFKSQRQSVLVIIPTTNVSRPQLKSNRMKDRVMPNNSQRNKHEVEDQRRNFMFSNNKTFVTACNDSLNAKTLNVNFVCVTYGKCVLNDNHDMYVHYINAVNSRTRQPIAVPISTRVPKQNINQSVATFHNKTVATESTVKKPRSIIRNLYEQVSKTCGWWCYTLSNTPLSSNSFAARRYNSIHRRLWVLKEHDGKSQAPKRDLTPTSTTLTPKQKRVVVERRNRTLVEAARTMLSAAKVPLFFCAEAIATTCFTQNRSLVIPRHEKTPYHIINGRKPSVKFFHIFGSLCYIVRDGENLDKMKEKGDACIFVGYSNQSRAYRVYNKRTRVIVSTIHVNFDELPQMALDHVSSDPVPQCPTTALEQDNLSPGPQSQENVPQAAETVTTSNELDLLFSLMFNELLNGQERRRENISCVCIFGGSRDVELYGELFGSVM
ncbi:retrovirus-related pol polyprotein from transposon TNT 1-94, partial [Tanacetum coccineum]